MAFVSRSPLHDLLVRDIASQGHRILLPFLTKADQVRWSVCFQSLTNYRYHLSVTETIIEPRTQPDVRGRCIVWCRGRLGGVCHEHSKLIIQLPAIAISSNGHHIKVDGWTTEGGTQSSVQEGTKSGEVWIYSPEAGGVGPSPWRGCPVVM